MENFKLGEVITEDSRYVNFDKFIYIYKTYKMNILDIIDLINNCALLSDDFKENELLEDWSFFNRYFQTLKFSWSN